MNLYIDSVMRRNIVGQKTEYQAKAGNNSTQWGHSVTKPE
jgi:hypothetical protein